MRYKISEEREAREYLEKRIAPGTTVYYDITSVSRSGMSRRIQFYAVYDGRIIRLTWAIAKLLGYSFNERGLSVRGCGMNMAFHVIYFLSLCLFNDGYALEYSHL